MPVEVLSLGDHLLTGEQLNGEEVCLALNTRYLLPELVHPRLEPSVALAESLRGDASSRSSTGILFLHVRQMYLGKFEGTAIFPPHLQKTKPVKCTTFLEGLPSVLSAIEKGVARLPELRRDDRLDFRVDPFLRWLQGPGFPVSRALRVVGTPQALGGWVLD